MSDQISCPVDDCNWRADAQPPEVGPGALADVFGPGVMAAVARNNFHRDLEERLDRHLQSHSVLEWVRTVGRLERELTAAQVREGMAIIRQRDGGFDD